MSKLEQRKMATGDQASAAARPGAAATPGKYTLVEAIPEVSAARSPVQRSGAATADAGATGSAPTVHAAAARGIAGNSHALPFGHTIQRLFGHHDVGGIRAHTDEAAGAGARAMGARAFASGDHIAFASPPDLHTAAHEAAHVVQQRAGVQLSDGVGATGDAYERNADAVADRVAQGLPADDLLPAPAATRGGAVQRAVQRQAGSDITVDAANRSALDAGLDPLFPTAALSGLTTRAGAEAFLTSTIATYFAAKAAADHQDHQVEQTARTTRALDAFTRAFTAQQLPDEAARVAAAARAYNDGTRGQAVEAALDEYRHLPVNIPGRGSIAFTVPYNRNKATDSGGATGEANGPGFGKWSAADIKKWVEDRVKNPKDDYFWPYMSVRVRADQPDQKGGRYAVYSDGLLSRALAGFCRHNKVGVDCNGLAWNVIEAADRMLGGDGLDALGPVSRAEVGQIAGPKFSNPVTDLTQLVPGDTLCWGDPTLFGTELAHHIMVITSVASDAAGLTLGIGHSNEETSLAHDDPGNDLPTPYGVSGGTLRIPAASVTAYAAAGDGAARKLVTDTWDWSGVDNMGTMARVKDLTGFWHVNWAQLTPGKAALGNAGFATAQGAPRQAHPAAPSERGDAGASESELGPLAVPTRARMERAFGADFASVRVHQGGAAPRIGAVAYAEGEELHFAPGAYRPGTLDGDRLIGHELAHVQQQREGRVAAPQGKGGIVADERLEREADDLGARAAAGEVVGRGRDAASGTARVVQRQGGGDVLHGDLKNGSRSADVGLVQEVLVRMRYLTRDGRRADNTNNQGQPYYGAYTTAAVTKFQQAEGIVPVPSQLSGEVTQRTWDHLQAAGSDLGAGDAAVATLGQQAVDHANDYWNQGANGAPLDRQHAGNVNQTLHKAGTDAGTAPYTPGKDGSWERTQVGAPPQEVNWCGMFATMALQEAGFGGDGKSFSQSLLSTPFVRGFFNYIASERNPGFIAVPDGAGGVQVMEVLEYHRHRHQMRRWLGPADVAAALRSGSRDFVQPGDVVTFGEGDGKHITLFDHWDGDKMVTIEGNAWGTRGSGGGPDQGDNEGVVKNTRELTASADSVNTEFTAAGTVNHTPIHGIGRYSPIDFETHVYGATADDAKQKASGAK